MFVLCVCVFFFTKVLIVKLKHSVWFTCYLIDMYIKVKMFIYYYSKIFNMLQSYVLKATQHLQIKNKRIGSLCEPWGTPKWAQSLLCCVYVNWRWTVFTLSSRVLFRTNAVFVHDIYPLEVNDRRTICFKYHWPESNANRFIAIISGWSKIFSTLNLSI